MPIFRDVVPSAEHLMGVKAVWGRIDVPVMCFGSRGDSALKDRGHFSQARSTAEKAIERPYLVTIGGGDEVDEDLRGRVLELVRMTGGYGETQALVLDATHRERLSRWPVGVIATEVYSIVDEPELTRDLGFPDRRILVNAFDGVRRDPDLTVRLWQALCDREVRRRTEVPSLPGFRDPGKVALYSSKYPVVDLASTEGDRVYKLNLKCERDRRLVTEAKDANRAKNGGELSCEACGFRDASDAMFDAHHLEPLAAGVRESRVDDLAVLCPTCHRWAHCKGPNRLDPVSVQTVGAAVRLVRR